MNFVLGGRLVLGLPLCGGGGLTFRVFDTHFGNSEADGSGT